MTEPSHSDPLIPTDALEARLRTEADLFFYPPTPDVAEAVRLRLAQSQRPTRTRRRLLAAMVAGLILFLILLGTPQVRAAIENWLRLGGVIVVPDSSIATVPAVAPTLNPTQSMVPPSPTAIQSLLDLAGETTLVGAEQRLSFPIRLPTYPADLGAPNRVFVQDMNGPVVILIWSKPDQPSEIRFALHILGEGAFVYKMRPTVLAETTLNGAPALWTEGPYFLVWRMGSDTSWEARRLINGKVLIWTDGDLTYRLESDLSLDEALKLARSIPRISP